MGMVMNFLRVHKAEFDKYLKEPQALKEDLQAIFEAA